MRIAGVGHRIHGDRRQMRRGIGREYVHVAVDDHSRVAYAEVLEAQDREAAVAFVTRALAWFGARGVTIRRVMTDNGSAYRSQSLSRRPGSCRRPSSPDATVHTANEWESGAPDSDAPPGMGVRDGLSGFAETI